MTNDRVPQSSESAKIATWKAALKKPPPKPYIEPPPEIPSSHVLVSSAGSGQFGSAYFCLPKDAVIAAKTQKQAEGVDVVTPLLGKLQVVKVSSGSFLNVLRIEIAFIKAIRERHSSVDQLPFFELTAVDPFRIAPSWFATSTLPVCCDLYSLSDSARFMPEQFTWLIFTQLRNALHHLHKACNPPLVHGDLHSKNVIVGYTGDSEHLQVKLIDFGLGNLKPADHVFNLFRQDIWGLAKVTDRIVHGAPWNASACEMYSMVQMPKGWSRRFYNFHESINGILAGSGDPDLYETLCDQFGLYANDQVTRMPGAAQTQIHDLVTKATSARSQTNHAKIVELLADDGQDSSQPTSPEITT